MKITKIEIVIQPGNCDRIILYTDLPEAVWPYEGELTIVFNAAKGLGEEYVATHFPDIPRKVVYYP
jgi:hypothetical protein